MCKKVIAAFLLMSMFLICGNVAAEQNVDFAYVITADGTVTITGYFGRNAVVNIPEAIQGRPVTVLSGEMLSLPGVRQVTIPATVIWIGDMNGIPYGYSSHLEAIKVSNQNNHFKDINGVLFDKTGRTLLKYPGARKDETYVIPEGTVSILDNALGRLFRALYLPSTLGKIGSWRYLAAENIFVSKHNGTFSDIDGVLFDQTGETLIYYPSERTDSEYRIPERSKRVVDGAIGSSYIEKIIIGDNLEHFGNAEYGYGMFGLKYYSVSANNPYLSSVDGVLFDKEQKTLYAYPKGRTKKSYKIPSTVKSIADGAFAQVWSLESVTIPDEVVIIGKNAFRETQITKIKLPSKLESLGESALMTSSELKGIEISSKNTFYTVKDGVLFGKDMKTLYRFSSKKYPKKYKIPDGVEQIATGAFHYAGLEAVELPESIDAIGAEVFENCWRLVAISLPDNLQSIGEGAFRWCSSLETIDIPDKVEEIGTETFWGCDSLVRVKLPKMLKRIDDSAFGACNSLISITIPEGAREISLNAFSWCENLEQIILPDGITVTDEILYGFSKKVAVYCSEGSEASKKAEKAGISVAAPSQAMPLHENDDFLYMVTPQGEVWLRRYKGSASKLVIPKAIDGYAVTTLKAYAFDTSSAWKIKSVTIPSSIITIEPYAMNGSFSIIVEDESASFAAYKGALYNKEMTRLISYPRKSGKIEKSTFPQSMTEIGDEVFKGLSSLTIIVPETVAQIGSGVFEDCWFDYSLTIPGSVTRLGDNVFKGCRAESIILSEGITEVGKGAFSGCDIKKLYLPDSLIHFPEENIFEAEYGGGYYVSDRLTVYCNPGSVAEQYCIKYGIPTETP